MDKLDVKPKLFDIMDKYQQDELIFMYPSKDDQKVSSKSLRRRVLEIGDEDTPDIYAIAFYNFRF